MSQTEVQLIKDAVIVNADVSNSAAIDVSKISGAMPLAGGTFTDDVTFTGTNYNISWDKSDNSLLVNDDARIKFGTGKDLHIYHNQSNSVIREEGTGNLNIQTTGGNVEVLTNTTETSAKFISNGAVELYHDNSKKLETHANGIHLSGSIYVPDSEIIGFGDTSNPDLRIFHNGNHSFITDSGTGNLFVKTSSFQLENAAGNETQISAVEDGAVELYHNGSKKLDTTSGGVNITGTIDADDVISIDGSSNVDLRILTSANNRLIVRGASSLSSIITQNNNNLSFRHDGGTGGGTEIFAMNSNGLDIGNNKRIHIHDFYGDVSGRIENSDSTNNSLRIDADPDNTSSGNLTRLFFRVDGSTKGTFTTDGLTFNSDTAADNALSDYEEGTFTPNNTIGMPLSSNFPAQYVKIGNLCWIMMDITFNSSPADTSQCGLIQNLPFTAKNLTNGEQYVDFPFISESGSNNLDHDLANTVTFIESQGTAIKLFNFGLNAIQQRAFLAGRRMRFNFCYRTE